MKSSTRPAARIVSGIVGLATAAAVVAVAPAANATHATKDIVIGVEAPLTGSQAGNGQDMLRGVKLAVKQINAKGGIRGAKVRIVELDDQANPDLAAAMVTKAKAAGVDAVVGPYNSSVGIINLPLYLKAKIVPVHMTSTNDTDGMGVTVQPKNNQIAVPERDYAKSLGAKNIAMLVDPSTYTQGMADRFKAAMVADGATVTSIPITEGQADYSAEVAQALQGVPDLVYVSTYYPEGSKIATSLVKSKLPTQCLMGLANVDAAFVAAAGVVASQRCAFSGIPEAAQQPGGAAKKYVAEYRKAFRVEPGVWGIYTYDSANMLFKELQRDGVGFKGNLADLKHVKNYPGATGKITIDPKTGNRVNIPVYILTVDANGNFIIK